MSTITTSIAAPNGSSSVQAFNPQAIDIVSRTAQIVNGMTTNGFDVMQFHNTINDALRNGTLNKMTMGNANSLLSTLPSDWKSKFTSDSSGMEELLSNINGLTSLANDVWSTPSGTTSSAWSQGYNPGVWSYGNIQPAIHETTNVASIASNAGTYKDGMADHPDGMSLEKAAGFGLLGYKAYGAGSQGLALLGDSEAAAAAGESVLGAVGLAGESGLGVTAAAVGSAVGITEIAAAAVAVAAIGYGIYKAAGGTGSNSLLDKAASTAHGVMDWFSANI